MPKVILISQVPLPFAKIGSWTTLYDNYIKKEHLIDFIICPPTKDGYDDIKYSFVHKTIADNFKKKFLKRKKTEYLNALSQIINPNDTFVIQLVDDYGMVKPLHDFLVANKMRRKCYIQFFYHGFAPYQKIDSHANFYTLIDEIVLLTTASYKSFKSQISVLPTYFSVLPNGIDTSKFKIISSEKKLDLKTNIASAGKTIFLWCAQDRPKKGLHIILDAWRKAYGPTKNIELLVIGARNRGKIDGVRFLGQIPNNELPRYYQIADCFLFSTLCLEGFGMTLIEALHCGCYCIASELGGVPEVLEYGKLGKLIQNPHFSNEWVEAMNEFLDNKKQFARLSSGQYSTEAWNNDMNRVISEAKERVDFNRPKER